jgi:adenylyltransferase/sulfurtransferase
MGKLTTFNALDFEFRTFKVRRDPTCPVCGENPTITKPIDYEQFCGVPIMDPKSQQETQEEVTRVKQKAHGSAVGLNPELDDRGLPPNYQFKPDWEVTPREVKGMLDRGEKFAFIDCRLPNEHQITHIEGTRLLPLQQLPQRFQEIADLSNQRVVVHCRSGQRSLAFAQALRQQGFKDVKSMAGGILLWNKDINPGGPQY